MCLSVIAFTVSWLKANQARLSEAIGKMSASQSWFQWWTPNGHEPKINSTSSFMVLTHVFGWTRKRFPQTYWETRSMDFRIKSHGHRRSGWPSQRRCLVRRARWREEMLHHAWTATFKMNCSSKHEGCSINNEGKKTRLRKSPVLIGYVSKSWSHGSNKSLVYPNFKCPVLFLLLTTAESLHDTSSNPGRDWLHFK